MSVDLVAAITNSNFTNPTEEQKEYFIDYVRQFDLKYESRPPQQCVDELCRSFKALATKTCHAQFSSNDERVEDMVETVFARIKYEWNEDVLNDYKGPLHELVFGYLLESIKFGPGELHVDNIWRYLFTDGFKEYMKNLPADKWRVIFKLYTKQHKPKNGEEARKFYDSLEKSFSYLIDLKISENTYKELQFDYADLYLYFATISIKEEKEERNSMHSMENKIYYKCNRNPFKEIKDTEYINKVFKKFIEVLSDPGVTDADELNKLESRFGEVKIVLEDPVMFEKLCGDVIDFLQALCNKTTGPPPHKFVSKVGYYWYHVKLESLKGKTGIFDIMAPKIAVFLETLKDHSYCEERLIGPAFNNVLCKFTNNSKEHQTMWVRLLIAGVAIPGCIDAVYGAFRNTEKFIKWKDFKKEAKEFCARVVKIRIPGSYEDRKQRDKGAKVDDMLEEFIKGLKKGKILHMFMPELMDFALTIIEERVVCLFESVQTSARNTREDVNIKDHRKEIFNAFKRLTAIMRIPDYPWTVYYSSRGLGELGDHIIKAASKGSNFSETEVNILRDFTLANLEGDMIDADENKPGGLQYDIFLHIGVLLKTLSDQGHLDGDKKIIPLYLNYLSHEEEALAENVSRGVCEMGAKGAALLAPFLGLILEAYLENQHKLLTYNLTPIYKENPAPMKEYFQRFVELTATADISNVAGIYMILTEVAKKQPQLFTEANVEMLVNSMYDGDTANHSYCLTMLEPLAARRSAVVKKQLDNFITKPCNEHYVYSLMKIIGHIGTKGDEKTAVKIMNFFVKYIKENDDSMTHMYVAMEMKGLSFKHRDVVNKHRAFIEGVGKKTNDGNLKTQIDALIDVLEGRSLETLADDLELQQEEVDNMDTRVTTNENNINTVTEEVGQQKKEIKKVKKDVNEQGQKLNELGEVVEDTVKKVEEIDQKTLSHAPWWSRDVSKLLNPESEHDWRLLSSRLGYSNDDIRAWAQQSDPCMAMLNEWYATHKTSEASCGVLNTLQEMDRIDAAIIVENAMKAADKVVEDEEFEYASPPPIFLSYQWGHQEEVKLLYQHLEMAGYDCWLDIGQMGGGDKLFEKIDKGIRAAKVIISCTTEKYAKSPNCNREVNLSVNLRKPIIPLLLENCPWPPEGSMGPIFSEYLYIQFYQNSKEDQTNDNRFWPVPKFQELLMQLSMNGIVPDETKVHKMYKNWWMPLVEEIKIDKSKTAGGGKKKNTVAKTTDNKEDDKSPDVFISYQWGKQKNIMLLYKRLTELGYHCWMDIHQMGGGDSLYDKIDRGIRGSKVVLSCLTEKYALSANCRREISLCDALKRPIIPLLLESMTWPPRGPMSMAFTELLYIDLHSKPDVQDSWSGPKFEEMRSKIREILPDPYDETEKTPKEKPQVKPTEKPAEKTKSTPESSHDDEEAKSPNTSYVKSSKPETKPKNEVTPDEVVHSFPKPKVPLIKRYTPPNKENEEDVLVHNMYIPAQPKRAPVNQHPEHNNNPHPQSNIMQDPSPQTNTRQEPPPQTNTNNKPNPAPSPSPSQTKSKSCSIL